MTALLPVLVFIQANLDRDLSLQALATYAELSEHHFQRLFRKTIGETPRAYVQRLRLESAALRLVLHDDTVLRIALDCGFSNHETFSRAFRRRFDLAPREYRAGSRRTDRKSARRAVHPKGFSLSRSRVRSLAAMDLAFLRHIGPYEDVPSDMWTRIEKSVAAWTAPGPRILMGIGHDSPSITESHLLRFDACVRVERDFQPSDRVTHQRFPGGTFAVTDHVGHYETLPAAYPTIFSRLAQRDDVKIVGLPVVEIYQTSQINVDYDLNHTLLCVPVQSLRP